MRDSIQKIKNLFIDWIFRQNHDREANRLNSELENKYYKSNSTDIIEILKELDKNAGLSSYDIVPFLKRIGLMPYKYSFVEKGSGGAITDRQRNDELFKELEQLEFIRIIENKLFSVEHGTTYPTPAEDCVLRVKLLPKGIDYLTEYRKRTKDRFYQKLTIVLLVVASVLSLPQACNQTLEWFKKDDTIYKVNIINKDSETKKKEHPKTADDLKDNCRIRESDKVTKINPTSKSTEHEKK
ncbi:hypothetical protein [Hanstruepera flava]|uniref:hypothetical protein n=1 Tax=Hanstruepera flava TaxID=2930218 RepID=UPI0020286FA1|nr:hypothetical protein [Hanstruepera flava]